MRLVGTQVKISDAELGADLSFVVRTSDEQAFRLLFPNGIFASDFQSAVLRFYSLIEEHDRNPETSVLNKMSSFRPRNHSQRILTWALDVGGLVEVDVIESPNVERWSRLKYSI